MSPSGIEFYTNQRKKLVFPQDRSHQLPVAFGLFYPFSFGVHNKRFVCPVIVIQHINVFSAIHTGMSGYDCKIFFMYFSGLKEICCRSARFSGECQDADSTCALIKPVHRIGGLPDLVGQKGGQAVRLGYDSRRLFTYTEIVIFIQNRNVQSVQILS